MAKNKNIKAPTFLTRKLTIKEQKEILSYFGFFMENANESGEKEHWVIYDEDGDEFYGYDRNLKFDLYTIEGILRYAEEIAIDNGVRKCQNNIRKVLGL